MRCVWDELRDLIDHMQVFYAEITDEWINKQGAKINWKKTQVADIDANDTLYQSIMAYVQLLNEKCADIALQLVLVCDCPVTARVKAQNSIEYKIQSYKTESHEWGRVPINKCVNDLFGVRVILNTSLTYEEIVAFVEKTYPQMYRCINSSKREYNANAT